MIKQFKLGRLDILVWIIVLMIGPSADVDTASIVSSQCSEVSTASVPVHGLHPQARVVRRLGQGEVSVRRHGSSRHQLPPRPKSLSMSVHTVQFEKGENKET